MNDEHNEVGAKMDGGMPPPRVLDAEGSRKTPSDRFAATSPAGGRGGDEDHAGEVLL